MLNLKPWNQALSNSLESAFMKRNCDINELEMLKGDEIPENTFLSIVSRNYTLNREELERELKTSLETYYPKMYHRGTICTAYSADSSYLGFYVYTTRPNLVSSTRYFTKKITLDEIIGLVASGDLILLSKTSIPSSVFVTKSELSASDSAILESLTLDTMGIESLSTYGGLITPILKKELTKERLSNDILLVIAEARTIAKNQYVALTTFKHKENPSSPAYDTAIRSRQKCAEFIAYLDLH